MSRYRRWNDLLELLATAGQLQVEEAAAALNVSPATVRRDFDELAAQQMLTRIRGGAVAQGLNYDLPLRYKSERHPSEKQRIGALAASMVLAGQAVGLNGGTTTTEVARALVERTGLTIVTNALNIASDLALRPNLRLIVTGGWARSESYELVGPLAEASLLGMNLDMAIVGVDGITAEGGLTTYDEVEAHTNRALIDRARRVVVVADGSKVGRLAFASICPIAAMGELITDASADPAELARLREAGATITIA